jgi:multidrug resistance efflux pump
VRDLLGAPPTMRVQEPQPQETARQAAPLGERRSSSARRLALRWILAGFKRLTTLAIALVAIVMALVTWDYYVTAPWTRDGSVRVQVASVAPQVSGQITELRVGDNQYVRKGDVLYVIDPFDFEVTLQEDRAQLRQKAADLQVKQVQSERRLRLSDLSTTRRNSRPTPATRSERKPRLTRRNNRWRRRRSICGEPRFAARSTATSRIS